MFVVSNGPQVKPGSHHVLKTGSGPSQLCLHAFEKRFGLMVNARAILGRGHPSAINPTISAVIHGDGIRPEPLDVTAWAADGPRFECQGGATTGRLQYKICCRPGLSVVLLEQLLAQRQISGIAEKDSLGGHGHRLTLLCKDTLLRR